MNKVCTLLEKAFTGDGIDLEILTDPRHAESLLKKRLDPVNDMLFQPEPEEYSPADDIVDELRYLLSDERIYRFVLSNIISTLHIFLSFMAFKNDVGFFKGRENMSGLSASSLISSFFCDFIIFLYLLDGHGTSKLVLFTVGGEVLVDFWKVSF